MKAIDPDNPDQTIDVRLAATRTTNDRFYGIVGATAGWGIFGAAAAEAVGFNVFAGMALLAAFGFVASARAFSPRRTARA
jgi:hypothetical protein